MKPEEIRRLYDDAYAALYEATFLTSNLNASDTAYELELLGTLLNDARTWLDVACGTGYFLRHFPHVDRTGIDLSPAMLDVARAANPGAELLQHDYRDDRVAWHRGFDLVSCMWYAYAYVDTMDDLDRLIGNLARWTSGSGTCFVPIADPALITGYPLPFRLEGGGNAGDVTLTGILWSYAERDGAVVHRHLIAPHPDYLLQRFAAHFAEVSLIRYPPAVAGWTGRPALIARRPLPEARERT